MLHDGESFKMEGKHGHHKNSNGHKYFTIVAIPQGFLLPVVTFSSVSSFRLCWFDWDRMLHFFKIRVRTGPFLHVISNCKMKVMKVSLMAWFELNVHKNKFDTS